MNIKMLSIDRIGLSRRSLNALHRLQVYTVGDMLGYTEESLLEVRNLGKKSVDEILQKIREYQQYIVSEETMGITVEAVPISMPENFGDWIKEEGGQAFVEAYLKEKKTKIEVLELLSPRAFNLLRINGYTDLHQIVFVSMEKLMSIPMMDVRSAEEIIMLCQHHIRENEQEILATLEEKQTLICQSEKFSAHDMLRLMEYHDKILQFVKANERAIKNLDISKRSKGRLISNGYFYMSDIIFMTEAELRKIPAMGQTSAREVLCEIEKYLDTNEKRIIAVCNGDMSELWTDEVIREKVLKLYENVKFGGLSFYDIVERLHLSEEVTQERLKRIIGALLVDKELEYVDFRCYRIYGSFSTYLEKCPELDTRSRDIIQKRLEGATLESIGKTYDLSRERVRQIIERDVKKVQNWYQLLTGNYWFDEDYFRYFYETYTFDKADGRKWLGISSHICNYLEMRDVKRGTKDLKFALDDYQFLNLGLRLKVKNYLNRNKLYLDGVWIEKKRADLEEYVVKKFCKDNVTFEEFTEIFNNFLEHVGIEYDKDIYYTENVKRSRKNRLAEAHFLLWKQGEQIRYYDIDGRDYEELFDELHMNVFENVGFSTAKFMTDYPDVIEKYDIRDQYELHNLLRKVVKEGDFHDFHCGRTPQIQFGNFDRDATMRELLLQYAPISIEDLIELVHEQFGYDRGTIQGTYLKALSDYYYKGMYRIDQKIMSPENMTLLKEALKDDLYELSSIREIYAKIIPGADREDINPYNLKAMGFIVLSQYAIQNYSSLEAYFEDLLTKDDITDLTVYKERFAYSGSFSQKLMELKRKQEVIEFEPNQVIHRRKLEASGITKDKLEDFCDAVYEYMDDGAYFSAQSLRQSGFETELYDLGFSDWFYANVILSDERFSFGRVYGNIILYKGKQDITIKSFVVNRIQIHRRIDIYDLITELTDVFGCNALDKYDLLYKVHGSDVYYDSILERFYETVEVYYRELDEVEDMG